MNYQKEKHRLNKAVSGESVKTFLVTSYSRKAEISIERIRGCEIAETPNSPGFSLKQRVENS